MGSKDPPNYNTCTECKTTVCHLCGFNPMPHTAVKEWLCLNCQTQRALSGQLGESGKIPQPSPVSAKPETHATLATEKAECKTVPTKADPTSVATKLQPTSFPIKEVPKVPTPETKMEPVKTESTTIEASTVSTSKPEVPKEEVVKTVTMENIKKAIKLDLNETEIHKDQESKPDLPKPNFKEDVSVPSAFSMAGATVAPTSCVSAELTVANVVPGAETKSEIKLTEPIQPLQQVVVQPKSQEQQPVGEQVIETDIKEVADKLVEKIIDASSSETQQVPRNNIIINEQAEIKTEPVKHQTTWEDNLDNKLVSVTATKPQSKAEEHNEDQPQILPISQESNDGQVVIDTSKCEINTKSMTAKEEVISGRRRLSFQAMDESSESELTPSPSPQVQRRRLKVTNISSSSEDIKTESADSSIEDEEFIRKQIMGMGDEVGMSLSDDEKEKHLANEEAITKAEFDNASVIGKPLSRKGSTDNEDSPARKLALPQTGSETTQDVPETVPGTTFKKAIPAIRQRQSTDEEVESISESLSKGSSSVQVSSFTPGSSPTSASSLEEDSDSSPSHRKVSGDKQHRKGKHRQQTQPMPTIEDSSEEEKVKEEERSRNEKEEFGGYVQPLSPTEDASSTEDLREVIMDATSKTSDSEHSASIESEPDIRRAVQRGCKPSPTVIPYSPSDQFRDENLTKSLKSAEEAYEELICKTKSIPGESPPDIEPLYGGMAIEDYLYESLVEEPQIKLSESIKEETMQETSYDSHKKLRSPEEVYEEMMQKKRELMMIEQEFQQAQTAMENSSSVADEEPRPLTAVETCVVTIPLEETSPTGQTDFPLLGTEMPGEVQLRKKKRPAPPRPSEPPKRSEVTAGPSTPSGSIGFVRPMVPQDPALTKALFPIPDLKITQCSSGEEEDDSLADEYGVGISSDITPSDDSDTKDPSMSPPLYDTAEMEPICVICEIPEPKPIPTPISAPELTTTPSPVSPMSPPTSPATPDSSLASNATSSSSVQAQTPLSSDSVPMSTPTPPPLFGFQVPLEISSPLPTTISEVRSTCDSCPTPTTVVVPIPDVVYDPCKAQTTAVAQIKVTTTERPTQGLVEMSAPEPVVVQMPDLVSSPSQVPIEAPAVIQVSAPTPAPVVVSCQPTVIVTAPPVAVSTQASACVVSASVTLAPSPVVVQMPDLVSTTTPISAQIPLPVSALVTTPAQAQAKVVQSVPVQPVISSVSPLVVPALAQTPHVPSSVSPSTTIVKKKVPPPPPPRSTSVSLPEPNTEQLLVKTVQHIATTMTTTTALGTTVAAQPLQSVAVDIQPRMEDIPPDSVAVPQIVTPTRQGHVVIIVPSVENISLLGQTHDVASMASVVSTDSLSQRSPTTTHQALDMPTADTALKFNKVSAVSESSAPPLRPKPITGTNIIDIVEIPVAYTPPQLPTISPKPTAYPKPPVPSTVTIATTIMAQVPVTTTGQITKPPPPIPPKPISIPAGLVFSHKPGESVKPPPPPVAPKAATLPRTKEPPNALSLSLTRPIESKLGATSPKSPVSPRHAKCLQTYVVITLPSEPGSPTESITVQAPVRRGSIPSTKVPEVQATPAEQKTPSEAFSAQAAVRRASVPTVRHPPPIHIPSTVAVEQVIPSEAVSAKVQAGRDFIHSVLQSPASASDVITVSLGQDTSIQVHSVPPPIKKTYVPPPQPQMMSEVVKIAPEPQVSLTDQTKVQVQVQGYSIPSIAHHPNADVPNVSVDAVVPQAPIPTVPVRQQAMTEVVAVPLQPEGPLDALVPQDRPAAVPVSTVLYPQTVPEIEVLQKEQYMLTDVIVTEEHRTSPTPDLSHQIPVQKQVAVVEPKSYFTGQELLEDTHTIPELPQTVPPLNIPPIVTEKLYSTEPHFLSEVMTIPTKIELPTQVITTDATAREAATISPVPYHTPVAVKITPTPEGPVAMQQTTAAKMISPKVAVEVRQTPIMMEVQPIAVQAAATPVAYIPQVYETCSSSVMPHSTPPLEVVALQPAYETPTEIITNDGYARSATLPFSVKQPQAVTGMPVGIITTEETTSRRRTSISSIMQPAYTTSEIFTYPTDYETPTQVITTEAFATTRRESITMQQPSPVPHIITMPAEKDLSLDGYGVYVPSGRASIPSAEQQPQMQTYSSEYEKPLETITTEAYTRRMSIPTAQDISQGVAPVTITKIQQESIESQEIRGPEKVVSSMSHMYSSISTSAQPPESLPSVVTQVVTTEVQRTTVSVVHERLSQPPPPSVAVTLQPDIAKVEPLPKQNGKIIYPGDVIDLRTMKVGLKMTEKGMDLTPPESCRQSFSHDSSGRQITAVQPEIVNLSAEITPATTLSVVTDSITIVTCTATIASYKNTPAEKPLDLQGPDTSLPLPLTTYKSFEPLAQIVYRPVNSQPKVSTVPPTDQDTPINLSFGAIVSSTVKHPVTSAPAVIGNGGPVFSLESTGAMDLSNYKPVKAMVALYSTSPGVVTTVVDDDGTPVDLTAGRRSVCCDVIYKLPFTGSCRTQPPVTTQPDNRFGYRDDHYQYDNAGIYGIKGMNGIKASMSETNLTEAGLFSCDPKNDFDYLSGSSDGAIDLTAAKLSAGKALDYTSKAAGAYPGMTTAPCSKITAPGFGVNSALRTSDGIVYSSVAAPVPSTYAITTQPGSIFSTTLTPTSTTQKQSLLHPYGFIHTTDPGQIIPFDTGLPKELLPTALADIITGYPDMYSDTTLEAIAASLDALASSPIFPGLDNTKMAQYQMEREFLELEKLKQLCLAEELEWERQEIQRYREQEQLMVQRELEELQALKQQLLLQQEEEHHAHMVAQQETYAQQKEQLQQIQQLQLQLQRQLDEHYSTSSTTGNLLDAKYAGVGDSGQYWPVKDESTTQSTGTQLEESQDQLHLVKKLQADQDMGKKIIDSGVQTDDEDSAEKQHVGRRKKNKRNVETSAQTDDEDQDEWDAPTKARRRSRKHSSDGKHGSKVSSIAIQTVAEISVQTDHSGTIKRPNVQMDTKVEIVKHISAPENSQRGGSLSCQTDSEKKHTPIEVGYSTHLTADVPSKSNVFYTQVSALSPEKSLGGQRMLTADPNRFSSGPRILKTGQKSLSDPKSLSPTTEDRMGGYYADSYSSRGSPSGTGKKVKRTLPDPPPEDDSLTGRSGYSTNSARRRLARSTTMARAKILQDIDKELDLVERESSKLRKKQAELDEEEKEIDAKLRYLEMGINRRKEALLKEREKRERAYLQGVAEERDYMSDSEVSNIREARGDGLERPRTAPQSEFDQFIPPQTEADSQYNTLTSPYSHYAQYGPQTQTTSHYTQQNLYQQQSLYHQQVSPYPTLSLTHGQSQPSSYQHALLLQQGKQRQTNLSDLEPKITTNYEVIRNQPLLIVPTSTEGGYSVAHLGGKYGSLDLRLGLEERSMASSPMSSISADSFYADIDHHNARNYVLIEDIGELTKASAGLSNSGLGSGFNLPDKELSKADRLLRAAEVRRTAEVADFLGSSRLQGYGKGEEDTMEEPYELKLLKQQIKQEFRRGTEGLEHLTGLGLPQYLPSDSSFRHFPKGEKYSISRLTLEKQAAKQLPAAVLYQKQMKNKKALIDPKAITKFSPIQESRDLEPDFGSYMGSGASSVTNLAARARLLQDEITFGLRKNLSEQQKYLGSSLGANLAGSLNLGQSLGLGSSIRATAHEDGTYPSGTSSLRLKTEGEVLDAAFAPGVTRAKPTSLPISQSRGRIPIVAQNSEEESPLSPVGQPMGMARASAGPLPPISADSRDQFGSSHSLPEVQQHMREESRTRGYDRDIAFIMDDMQGAMSDSEALSESMLALNRDDARIFHESIRHAGGPNWNIEAYHLRREDTDWFDKPREGHPQSASDRRQMKLVPYAFPHTRIKLKRDLKDTSVSGNGLGIRVVGGKEIPGSRGDIGAYVAKIVPGGVAEQTGKVVEGMQVLEWSGVPLMGKTYEEVQCIMGQPCAEVELCVRLDLNMLSDPEHPQALEHHVQLKSGGQRSPGVDPKQLAAELQKVSQQQTPGLAGTGVGPGGLGVLSALERSALLHSGTGSAASSGVPSPGQPASPAISKKQRHKQAEVMKMPHPITGEIQLQINYDRNLGNLIVHVLQARNLAPRDNNGYSDPFVKVYLLPGRGQVMVVQNASADNKRRTKYAQKTMNPEWNQTVIYKNIHLEQLKKKTLEVTVWDYDKSSSNDFLGEVLIDLSNTAQLDNTPRWLPLKEQSESIEHSRIHHAAQGPPGSGSGQGHGQSQGHVSGPGMGPGHGLGQSQAPGQGDGSHDSPKNSVIKSRSHGIFPDPAKDMQMLPLEKSHSSPGSSKSSSDGQLRSHGPSRSQSKSSVTQAHLEDAGIAIAAAEAAVQQSRLQPRPGHRLADVSGSVVLSAPSLVGDAYGGLDGEDGAGTGVDSAIFQVPRIGKTIPNGTDKNELGTPENEGGKTQVMGEIKVALKKEVKTEGDQLVLEILQCRNITYKFKSPDHLPDLYVKLYVVNVATQKRIIKKKTRVCRHDREPSFNETFRFPLNPTGHSIQLFLVSNGGKFMKKTLIGEAYIWLDKVDMRKRVVSWHKLFVSSTQTNP
ncbi:hypothetical protein Q5P01_012386 [Channa striata]|uniref:Protein piccolo n=1 Tax=Channa striata TaxID=64152 RepID=A0AA88MNR2_CHASR|nr:hypothetical protein Q5P01_012386 [Channa striata]